MSGFLLWMLTALLGGLAIGFVVSLFVAFPLSLAVSLPLSFGWGLFCGHKAAESELG